MHGLWIFLSLASLAGIIGATMVAMAALRNKGRDCNISDLIGEKSQDYGRLWRHGQVWVGSAPKRLFKNPFKKGP